MWAQVSFGMANSLRSYYGPEYTEFNSYFIPIAIICLYF